MRKNKQNLILISTLLIFLVLVVTLGQITRKPIITTRVIDQKLTQQGYSNTEISALKTQLEPDELIKISTLPYQIHVLDFYRYPHYQELINLGYTHHEARLLSEFEVEDLLYVLQSPPLDHILEWLKSPYLVLKRLSRYQAYALIHETLSQRTVIERVNTDRDYPAYTHTVKADTSDPLILVNKYHDLSSSYVPSDLVIAKGCGNPTLTQEAANAYDLMCIDITKAGLYMNEATSYRSYSFQASIYNSYLKTYGQTYTDTIAARPGFSEHQTGLAVDLNTGDPSFSVFIKTETYQWVSQNCTKYGFILRYPHGKEDITGYRFESWHYRYVGVNLALKITKLGLTLDEYTLLYP